MKADLEKLQLLTESDAQFAPLLEKIYNELKSHLQQYVSSSSHIWIADKVSECLPVIHLQGGDR